MDGTDRPENHRVTSRALLPSDEPLALLTSDGRETGATGLRLPPEDLLRELYRGMVVGRRFDAQATTLTKQGRLAVYPSSLGQEACQIGAIAALRRQDWLFPTYRDCVALVSRGIDPVEALTLLRGDWHCGYDPAAHRVAPQCTPLATNAPHAVGVADAGRRRGEDAAVLVMLGDGATSEGDTHEALNVSAVWHAPVVFFIQNNGYAISVPLSKQTAAPSLAHKGIGYGIPSVRVDGNDAAAVYASVRAAVDAAATGDGPTLIEAVTYRIAAHTNADDETRYRSADEVAMWRERDPITRLERYLTARGALDETAITAIYDGAERFAAKLRDRMSRDPAPDPMSLFRHVYAEPTAALRAQQARLAEELT
jgi:2-oxoisovalerate dehydrogenase E1 component alpha subunit